MLKTYKIYNRCCLFFVVALFTASYSYGQDVAACANLMKFGIYDKYRSFTTETHYKQVREFFKNNQFSSSQQAQSKAGELGLDIVDILSLNFGGTTSSSNFQTWQQELIRSSYQQAISMGLSSQNIEKISNAITDLVGKCIAQKGVHAYIIPNVDNQTFSVTVDFVPLSGETPYARGAFTLTPASVAASCSPNNILGQQQNIGPQGLSISCRRLPTETVAVTVNTDNGSPVIHYDPYVVPDVSARFFSDKYEIDSGETAVLGWEVFNASRVEIEGFNQVTSSGNIAVSPMTTTKYRMILTSLGGQQVNQYVTITVRPPKPTLTGARVKWVTTNDNKDHDTRVTVNINCGGSTIASVSDTWGEFGDNSDSGWKGLNVIDRRRKENILGICQAQLIESPVGHDEWHANMTLILTFSDGSVRQYDWGVDVDYDRNVKTWGL